MSVMIFYYLNFQFMRDNIIWLFYLIDYQMGMIEFLHKVYKSGFPGGPYFLEKSLLLVMGP